MLSGAKENSDIICSESKQNCGYDTLEKVLQQNRNCV